MRAKDGTGKWLDGWSVYMSNEDVNRTAAYQKKFGAGWVDMAALGVYMGKGFINALDGFKATKEYIKTESRLIHGVRLDTSDIRFKERTVTLPFSVVARQKAIPADPIYRLRKPWEFNWENLEKSKAAFERMLYAGEVELKVVFSYRDELELTEADKDKERLLLGGKVFTLVYNDASTYTLGRTFTSFNVSVKFTEPNPASLTGGQGNVIIIDNSSTGSAAGASGTIQGNVPQNPSQQNPSKPQAK